MLAWSMALNPGLGFTLVYLVQFLIISSQINFVCISIGALLLSWVFCTVVVAAPVGSVFHRSYAYNLSL